MMGLLLIAWRVLSAGEPAQPVTKASSRTPSVTNPPVQSSTTQAAFVPKVSEPVLQSAASLPQGVLTETAPAPAMSPSDAQRQRWLNGKVVFTEMDDNDAPRPITTTPQGYRFSSLGWRCSLRFGDTGDPSEISCSGDFDPPARARLSCSDIKGGRVCGAWYATPYFASIGKPRHHLAMQLVE